MADIQIEEVSDTEYRVTVSESGSATTHTVTADPGYCASLKPDSATTAELISRSFEFLLERESKESILRRFELPVIGRYFPEYESEIRRRMGS